MLQYHLKKTELRYMEQKQDKMRLRKFLCPLKGSFNEHFTSFKLEDYFSNQINYFVIDKI